jgi:uncharacterized protein (DUF488 family)
MEQPPIYTIGHGRRLIEDLIYLLQARCIRYLVDVRSIPFSRFNPQYNQPALQAVLAAHSIRYVYMGDTLGGRPADPALYQPGGRVDYTLVSASQPFRRGIARLKKAYEQQIVLAIMCSESDPCQCHRSKLVGEALVKENIQLQHIDEQGQMKEHEAVIFEMSKGWGRRDLFK